MSTQLFTGFNYPDSNRLHSVLPCWGQFPCLSLLQTPIFLILAIKKIFLTLATKKILFILAAKENLSHLPATRHCTCWKVFQASKIPFFYQIYKSHTLQTASHIARGPRDPGYSLFNLNYLVDQNEFVSILDISSFAWACWAVGHRMAPLPLITNLATRWHTVCISCHFGY